MSDRTRRLSEMEAEHRRRVDEIRADSDLTYEARERRVKEAGDRYYAARRKEERAPDAEGAA